MELNQTLINDMNNIMETDVPQFRNELVKNLPPKRLEMFMDQIEEELKTTFDTYGVDYNFETLKAAVVTLIWTASGTQSMFPMGNDPVPHNKRTPVGYALYGMMQAFPCVVHALENYED